jgi:HSP20 family molecular chaperone IbpA
LLTGSKLQRTVSWRFDRQVSLDRDVDESAVDATFRNGTLTVDLRGCAASRISPREQFSG